MASSLSTGEPAGGILLKSVDSLGCFVTLGSGGPGVSQMGLETLDGSPFPLAPEKRPPFRWELSYSEEGPRV